MTVNPVAREVRTDERPAMTLPDARITDRPPTSGEQPSGKRHSGKPTSGQQPSGQQPSGQQPSGEQPSTGGARAADLVAPDSRPAAPAPASVVNSSLPFESVLVANRGEIACRVIRTLRRVGIRSVAVFSDADQDALHVREADAAVRLGPAAAARSYLDVDAVVAAAVTAGAQAVHPGYGFLSESAELARACRAAGLVFVGPSVEALETMGDKVRAKELVAANGVPVVPGSSGHGLDDAALVAAAEDVGFPLLVKPAAGGGGKGMQVVRSPGDLPGALASARRVATAAFGDDTLLLERLIERPRHIEIQVLADRAGATVHLGERECSLQRRHQKVIEESPSPLVDAAMRERMGAAAIAVARAVGYEGVGTVEFLVSDVAPDEFFFIEMNTRLQVEHPVTELVTGVDLVEQQLLAAAGRPLAFAQRDIRLEGHAIEARIYAESPVRGHLPATGEVLAWLAPAGPGLRVDSGVATGTVVTDHYDPMLAKAVAHGTDRADALTRLEGLLRDLVVLGVDTNADEVRAVLADPDVRAGRLDTGLLDRRGAPTAPEPDARDLAAAALLLRTVRTVRTVRAQTETIPNADSHSGSHRGSGSPWALDGWRPQGERRPTEATLTASDPHREWRVLTTPAPPASAPLSVGEGAPDSGTAAEPGLRVRSGIYDVEVAGVAVAGGEVAGGSGWVAAVGDGAWRMCLDGIVETVHGAVTADAGGSRVVWLRRAGRTLEFRAPSRAERIAARVAAARRAERPSSPELRTPMPGTVVAVPIADGSTVAAGTVIATVEAMKMEHALLAPVSGVVHVSVRPGDPVSRDQLVAEIEADPASATPADGASATGIPPSEAPSAAAPPAAADPVTTQPAGGAPAVVPSPSSTQPSTTPPSTTPTSTTPTSTTQTSTEEPA